MVTVEQALAHPTWNMEPVVTVNSATLMNKGLEVIEAHELFGLPYDAIDVVVHPQSLVHSLVEFTDGSSLAQVSPPDMRLPIALGLAWPRRIPDAAPGMDWSTAGIWEFFPLDTEAFPAVVLAREAGRSGGSRPAVFNAANEECVGAFLHGQLPFTGIVDTVAAVLADAGIRRSGWVFIVGACLVAAVIILLRVASAWWFATAGADCAWLVADIPHFLVCQA